MDDKNTTQTEKQSEKIARSQVQSFVHFANETEKSRKLSVDLFDWGMLFSTYSRLEDGKFNKKANKNCFYGQRDFSEIVLMLHDALADFKAGKEFEYAVKAKKGAFGAWSIKKDNRLIGGLCIYDVDADGNVIQKAKDVVPITNNSKVVKMSQTGEVEPLVQEAFIEQVMSLIKKIGAIGNGTSNIYTAHLTKMGQIYAANNGQKNPEATTDGGNSAIDLDSEEYPF